jgi:hypothetical protein
MWIERKVVFGVLIATLVVLGNARRARADAADEASARALFGEGQKLVQTGQYGAACPKFEAASRLFESAGLLVNLGDCYEKLGRTASASDAFAHAVQVGTRANRPNETREATRRQQELAGRLTRLSIRVPREVPGLKVTRDGVPVPSASWNTPIAVDPGTHLVRAEADGYTPWIQSVAIAEEGRTATVDVPELASSPTPTASTAPAGVPGPRAAAVEAPGASPRPGARPPRFPASLPPPAPPPSPDNCRTDGDPRHHWGFIDAMIGPGYSTLASFNSSTLAAQNISGGGLVVGAGAGLRLSFLTLGARARALALGNLSVWEIDGETAFHVQVDSADVYLGLRGGYAVGSVSTNGSNGGGGDVDGFNIGTMLGFDSFITGFLSWGLELNPELLDVQRPPLPLPAGLSPANLTPAQQGLYEASGLNVGLVFIASVHLGLHF